MTQRSILGEGGAAERLLGGLARRIARRRTSLGAAGVLTLGFLLAGGLSVPTAVLGMLAVLAWAGLWPEVEPSADAATSGAPVLNQGATVATVPANSGIAVWRTMLDGLPDAALVLDREAIVMAANARAGELLASRAARHISQLSRSPELLAAVDLALETGEAQTCRTRMPVPVDRHVAGLITPLARLPYVDGAPTLLVVLRDLTEQEQLARMRADFVANASHELRTPLASLKGFVETLQGAAKDDPAARERFLHIMHEQAGRMSRLIEDLLSLSRIEMREHVAPQSVLDMGEIVTNSCRALEPLAKAANITLTLVPAERKLLVVGDRDELLQLVQNLVQNSIKYGKRGGHVTVALGADRSRVTMTVSDDGIGIAPEHLPRLTERFYRVSAKDSRERGGTGLGLAIVKHIVNRHLGELRITSTLGAGSRFTVLLPSAATQEALVQPSG